MATPKEEDLSVLVRNDTHERNLRATELHADTVLEDKAENTLIELGALRGARNTEMILSAVNTDMTSAHDERVAAAFRVIDVNADGTLTAEEIIRAIHKNSDVRSLLLLDDVSDLTATEYTAMFARIDVDNSRGVDFAEFGQFVDLLFKEEFDKRTAAKLLARELEDQELEANHMLNLATARDRLTASQAALDLLVAKYSDLLGSSDTDTLVNSIRANPGVYMTSEKKVEMEFGMVLLEHNSATLAIRVLTGAPSSNLQLDPHYNSKLILFHTVQAQYEQWYNVEAAFRWLAGPSRTTVDLDLVVERLHDKNEEGLWFKSMLGLKTSGGDAPNRAPDAAEEKKDEGVLSKLRSDAADSSPLDSGFSLAGILENTVDTGTTESAIAKAIAELAAFGTIEITLHHFNLTFTTPTTIPALTTDVTNTSTSTTYPSLGDVHASFSYLTTPGNDIASPPSSTVIAPPALIKTNLLTSTTYQLLLALSPPSPSFDALYTTLLATTTPYNLRSYTTLINPHAHGYPLYKRLHDGLPQEIMYGTSGSRDMLTAFYGENPHLLRIVYPQIDLSTFLDSLPENNITLEAIVTTIDPTALAYLCQPQEYIDSAPGAASPTDSPTTSPRAGTTSTTNGTTLSAIEAAYSLLSLPPSPPPPLFLNTLLATPLSLRLLSLPTSNHAKSATWKSLVTQLKTVDIVTLDAFTALFTTIPSPRPAASNPPSHNPSRRNSKTGTAIRAVPVLDVTLAELYHNVRTAWELLTLTNGFISCTELEAQCLGNEGMRDLIGVALGELEGFVRGLGVRSSASGSRGDEIGWEVFRDYFVKMQGTKEITGNEVAGLGNRHTMSQKMVEHMKDETDMRNMVMSMEAMINTTLDDQEATPALNEMEEEVVNDLTWIMQEEDWAKQKGPPNIPERGREVSLAVPYVDGPKWYVVLSPREVNGCEGPLGIKRLIDYWDDEFIDGHSLVWKEGLDDWLPIEDVADLKAQLLLPELHATFRPQTAPGAFSSIEKKRKVVLDPKPVKLDLISLEKCCNWCGGLATSHIEVPDTVRPLNQGLKEAVAVASSDSSKLDDKSEVLNDFLFLGNAAASRERPSEIMEYTHVINCSVELPCYWDYEDPTNAWMHNNVKLDEDGCVCGGDDKAVSKYKRLKYLNVKYFRVGLDDDPFGRPDTAASKFSVASWRESEFSSRPLTALTDPLFGKDSRPGTRERVGSSGGLWPRTGSASRPMTGGLRPMTPCEIEIIPEFDSTSVLEREYAQGYNAAVVSIQATYRGSKSRESSRPSTADYEVNPPPMPGRLTKQRLEDLEEAKLKLGGIRKIVAEDIINSFEAVFEWLSRENADRKVRCLVHSNTGFCSAAAVVAAYIIRTQGLSYEETLSHLRTKHGVERIQIMGTVWEDALRIYAKKYSIGRLVCDDCFLEQFVEGKADERVFSEKVEKVVKRLELNDESLTQLDLRDEVLGTEGQELVDGEESGIKMLCFALRDSAWLRELDLSGNMINDEDCKLIGNALLTNDGLNVLNLSYNKIGDTGCKEIAAALKLHSMGVLNLSYNSIKAEGGTALGKMLRTNEHLYDLNIRNNSIGDTGGYNLFDSLTTPMYESEEVMLAKAEIYKNGGEIDDVEEQFNVTLCVLDVSCNDLGQESAKRLVGVLQVNVVLTVLNLDYNPKLGNTEAREIASALRTFCPSLEWLGLSENNVGNDVAGAFARSIGDNNTLIRRLSFAQNCLRSTGISRISTALRGNCMLVFLDLGRNPMGSKGCMHIAEALGVNRTLKELLLDCCGIDAEGCRALGEVLAVNNVLQKLDLSDNSILTKGVESLCAGLKENRGIRELNMTNTGIGVKASECLSECLRHNEVIRELNVSNNQVRNHGCKQFADMLAVNVSLVKLDLSFNMISAIGVNSIVESVNKRDTFKYEVGKMKALELDVKLVGNLFSKDAGVVDESQLVVLPKMARSKMVFDSASSDSRDVPMWQKERADNNKNFVRRGSFSVAAGKEFDDVVDVGKKFWNGGLLKSSSTDVLGGGGLGAGAKQLGVVTKIAEQVDVPRFRERMETYGNDTRNFEKKKDAWNTGFSEEAAYK